MGCKVCDKEYKSVLPKLAIMVYAGMNRMSVKFDDDMNIYTDATKALKKSEFQTLETYLIPKE